MKLTKEIIEEVVLAAQDIDYGSVTIVISGQPQKKIVDIVTEKRERYRENVPTLPGEGNFQKDKYFSNNA